MEKVYQYLTDISHNRKKLHFFLSILCSLLVVVLCALGVQVFRGFLEQWQLADGAKNLAVTLIILIGFVVYTDYKNQTHSVSRLSLTNDQLWEKYSGEVEHLLRLDGIKLRSVELHRYEGDVELSSLSLEVENRTFQIPWYLEQYCKELIRPFNPAKVFNGKTLRFEGFAEGNPLKYLFSYSTYFDYLISNGSHDQKLFNQLTVRDLLEPGPRLSPLAASSCSNHLGLSCLVFSVDGHLLLQQRSKSTAVFSGKLASSISGAANIDTFLDSGDSLSFASWFENEMHEELSPEFSMSDFSYIRLLGVSRELVRLGKPELFLIAKMKKTRDEIADFLNKRQRQQINLYGALSGSGVSLPTMVNRSEAEKFVWLEIPQGVGITEILRLCGISENPYGELQLRIDGATYTVSESLAANLAFAV